MVLDEKGARDVEKERHIKKYFFGNCLGEWIHKFKSHVISEISPIGHSGVLSYPDKAYLKWQYIDYMGRTIKRDNPLIFLEAAEQMYIHIRRFMEGDSTRPITPLDDRRCHLLHDRLESYQDESSEKRHRRWLEDLANGAFGFEPVSLKYHESTGDQWEMRALGYQVPEQGELTFTSRIFNSNWWHFQTALSRHVYVLLHEVLPQHELCVT
jgi:hypothetical protein